MSTLVNGIKEALGSIALPRGRVVPSRVRATIVENEASSEILVRLIQLAVGLGLGILFFLTPDAPTTLTSQVPLIVGLYVGFTLFTLALATRGAMPNPVIILSIFVDVGLLTYLIFSFHIQYEQPASFSLKSPSFSLYFVLIALRALRFDYRYVLTAGVSSILAWIVLVIIVTRIDPQDSMITRDYVTYLTSNTVLIGAEVDKMTALAIFTMILALAVHRAHAFFVRSISEAQAVSTLSRFMPGQIADSIVDADKEIAPGEGQRRDVAILNIDIRGFSQMVADAEPQETVALLSRYQSEIVPIIHKHGGIVDKFMGDGIMAVFGLDPRHPLFAADTLRCVEDIIGQSQKRRGRKRSLAINLAVATGPVVHGAIGTGDRLEYTVIGATVNRSAKLEKFNKEVRSLALCDSETLRLAREQGYSGEAAKVLRDVGVPGIELPMDIVVLA